MWSGPGGRKVQILFPRPIFSFLLFKNLAEEPEAGSMTVIAFATIEDTMNSHAQSPVDPHAYAIVHCQICSEERPCATTSSVTGWKLLFSGMVSTSTACNVLRPSSLRILCGIGRSMSTEAHLRAPSPSTSRLRSASRGPPSTPLEPTPAKKTCSRSSRAGGSNCLEPSGGGSE